MAALLSALLLVASVFVAVTALVLFFEIVAAMVGRQRGGASDIARPAVVILIPAHDEGRAILPTLGDVKAQMKPGDRLLVVADNCSDDTAEVAEAAGAEVIRRNDPQRLGKSFALDFGFRALKESDPTIGIVVDADCRLEQGTIDHLARACNLAARPVQALYLMRAPEGAIIKHQISEFAWRVRNDLRPRGLHALGLPCQLMGSGMAFPRSALARVELASGHLVEDLDLGLKLAAIRQAPLFCPEAIVTSEFPSTEQASRSQRQRWEHGQLSILAKRVVPYLWSAVRHRNGHLLVLTLDAAVPPLVLLGLLILMTLTASALVWHLGETGAPLLVSGGALTFFVASLVLAWVTSGRRDLSTLNTLTSAVPYVSSKFAIYARALAPNKKWVRTHRTEPN